MTTSAICKINNTVLAISGTTGFNANPSSTITISLQNSSGVESWFISATSSDGLNPNSAVGIVNSTMVMTGLFSATFVMPSLVVLSGASIGGAIQFTSTVNAGLPDENTITFGVWILGSSGLRMVFNGENLESNATVGVAPDINELLVVATSSGGTFTAGGDLSGSNTNQTVIGLQGNPVSGATPSSNQVLEWNGTNWHPTALPSALPPSGSAGGDLTGTYPNPTIVSIGALAGGGTELVTANNTGTLGQVTKTLSGDLTGTYPSGTVIALQGNAISATAPTLTTQVLQWSGSAWTPTALPTGLPPTGSAGGDLSGTYPNPTVAQAQNGDIVFGTTSISFATGIVSPSIIQTSKTTNSGTANSLTIQAQNETGTSSIGGALVLTSGTGTSSNGALNLQTGGSTVIGISGTTVSIPSLSTAGILHNAVTTGALSSSLIVNADVSATAVIAVSKLAAGTSAQVLLNSGTPSPTWTSLSGDMTVGNTGTTTVAKVNGSSIPAGGSLTTGNGPYVSGASALSYSALNLAGGSGWVTGNLPIANLAGGGAGTLFLQSVSGTNSYAVISAGSLPTITLTGDVTGSASGGSIATTAVSVTGSGGTLPVATTAANIQWATGSVAPTLSVADKVTNSGTGSTLTIQAQNETGTSSTGGALDLSSGTGTTAPGIISLMLGGVSTLSLSGGTTPVLAFANTATSPIIRQNTNTTNSTTGQPLLIASQSSTGTTSVGGQLQLKSGTGTTSAGSILLETGNTQQMLVNPDGYFVLSQSSTNPGNPGAGFGSLYLDSANSALKMIGGLSTAVCTTTLAVAGSSTTVNTQSQIVDMAIGTVETVSSSTATTILNYNTASNTGGLVTIILVSRATTSGTGIAIGDTATATYVLAYKNVSGTTTLSTVGITLVGAIQTTASALTSTLGAGVSTSHIIFKVTNTALCTVDSEVYAEIVVC